MADQVDIAIVGGGPIGAATAYYLTQAKTGQSLAVISKNPSEDSAAWQNAGGSVRWFWDDEEKRQATKATADFAKKLSADGVDLALLQDNYLFMHRGVFVPSINISGGKLVDYFLHEAEAAGAMLLRDRTVTSVKKFDGGFVVTTDKGDVKARVVLMALGAGNPAFLPGYELELEKRQLFILDLPVNEDAEQFPHVILPVGDGIAYVFIKKFPDGLKFVVGQEDAVEVSDEPEVEDYFSRLLDAGLGEIMPFLRQAKVAKIGVGMDAGNKTLKLEEVEPGLYAANCGSAIRSCVAIGQTVAAKLLESFAGK